MGRSLSHRGKLQQNGEAGWFRRLESFCCLALVARPTSLAAGTESDRFFLSRKRLVLSCAFTRTREISQIGTLATTVVPFSEEDSSSFPPNCRRRSFIPRNPTPRAPIQSWPDCSKRCGEMPFPLSSISKAHILCLINNRMCATWLPECRRTSLRLSCALPQNANRDP